jgi:glycosyltransferase involved in cell wall biosynthesis
MNLLFVGPVNPIKGVIYLVRALRILRERGSKVHLHVIGAPDRSYKKELDREIERGRLDELVTFHGYISDKTLLAERFSSADIFVLPSLVEGFPRVIYEAMISKLPVISSDLPSIRGNLEGWDCVYFVPPRDQEAIASAILDVVRNADLRKRMVQNGLQFVRTKVPQKEHFEQVAELIQKYA